ncbi:UNKNOWN [Stylonychia lemnae]|uniref:Uncharacterized protein n=1 Tax=Stylonychia lemnae TaxID=5949 RepID=A0A077ZQX8_STYLE|nr:UNKNOWN [Stylonychia lemnae]|eukprot:CDW71844.1 UNKNOWN [Stylonychia lemnae]
MKPYQTCRLILTLAFLCFASNNLSKELQLITELETQLLMNNPDNLPHTYFLLICYQKDIKCADGDEQVLAALDQLKASNFPFEEVINSEFKFRRVECIRDYQRKLCQLLGQNHYLKPVRIQIIGSAKIHKETPLNVNDIKITVDEKANKQMVVYKFSSPIQKEYILKRILMFSVPTPIIAFDGPVGKISELEDVKVQQNVIFALQSQDTNLVKLFKEVASQFRERFYFVTLNDSNQNETQYSQLHAVGFNFTKTLNIQYNKKNPALTKMYLQAAVQEWQSQDLKYWDFKRHIQNQTYIDSLEGKLIIVGMAGKQTSYLTTDFLYDFRKLAQHFRYSLNKYEFALIDIDNEEMFNYLTTYQLGRFDSPGIFIIEDIHLQKYYRNYETYNGNRNFKNISDNLIAAVNLGEKSPLYSFWKDCYLNLVNIEHWNNNRLKGYMYFLGVISTVVLPFAVLLDCFFPIFGRGPHARKKKEGDDQQQHGSSKADKSPLHSKKQQESNQKQESHHQDKSDKKNN